jgi:hypothetical protein
MIKNMGNKKSEKIEKSKKAAAKKKAGKKKKIKILAVGDIHGDTGLVKKLAKRAKDEGVDFVILAGDITLAEQSTDNLIGPFVKAGKKVLLIPGNHETIATADFLAEMYGIKNIHGYSVKAGDIGIFGAGGADIGITAISEKEMMETLKRAHKGVKDSKRKIMITHMQPKGTSSEASGFHGSKSIRKAVEYFKPDLLIHIHIHETEGIEDKIGNTRVINVGRKGKIIEL